MVKLNSVTLQVGERNKEGNVLFNNALNTFLRLYGTGHMVKGPFRQ